jgi:2-C-methyl-D-erythritol 4-phosphate cytidylyltransferase
VETLRFVPENKNVLRSDYRLVQTPQCFDINLLKKANQQPYSEKFTDDASIVEAIGQQVTMVEGNRENIKITTPFDLTIATALVANQK